MGNEIIKLSDYENFGSYSQHMPESDNAEFLKLDITDRDSVLKTIVRVKPDCVIHCASEIRVDFCENNKDAARKVNVDGTRNVADAAKACGAKLIFVSTDHVFDGSRGNYSEVDETNPANFYGRTKLEGEKIVEECENHFIGRGGVMYSAKKGTFTSWVLRDLSNGEVKAATDLISCPTFATELAECIIYALKKDLRGLYHTAGGERISKFDFIRKFATAFGFDSNLVKPISVKDLHLPAPRPHDSSLNISKIRNAGYSFSDVDSALRKLKNQLKLESS